MIHLIWSGINLIIILYFFYLIIGFITRGTKIFNPQIKTFSIVLMVIGIFQIISARESEEDTNRIVFIEKHDIHCDYKTQQVRLENNLTLDIEMLATYCTNGDKFKVIETYSNIYGFVTGFEWKYKSSSINENSVNGKIEYNISGILKWNIFGINIYSQQKTFKGTFE